MTWGIPTEWFLQIHVVLSLIGIVSGIAVLFGLLTGRLFTRLTAVFLVTTILTSVTGFPLPPPGFDPPRALAVLSLIVLAIAVAALYSGRRRVFVGTAMLALYVNVFVGVVQAFQKLPFLRPLAPTQSELPFLVAQIGVLAAFIVFGILAVLRFGRSGGKAVPHGA